MRILAVAPYYAPEGGGLERYAHAILRRLAAQGHRVHAVAFTRNRRPSANQDGVDVQRLEPRLRLGNTPLALSLRRRLDLAVRSLQPDVVVAHTPVPFPAEMAYLAARRHGIPFVTTYHAGQLHGSNPFLEALARLDRVSLQRRMLAGSARLIAVSNYVRSHALNAHQERTAIVPPGVDTQLFTPGGPPARPNILFVGPLDSAYRWKGLDVLWNAYVQARRQHPDLCLTLVGDGDRMPDLARRARPYNGAVRLTGRLSDVDLCHAYRQATLVALPSTSPAESFGMVLAEANACARPVVASRIGGIPDFVRHGRNGLLATPGNAHELAQRFETLLEDPDQAQRLGQHGHRLVLEHHDWDRLAAQTQNVLARAAHREAPIAA